MSDTIYYAYARGAICIDHDAITVSCVVRKVSDIFTPVGEDKRAVVSSTYVVLECSFISAPSVTMEVANVNAAWRATGCLHRRNLSGDAFAHNHLYASRVLQCENIRAFIRAFIRRNNSVGNGKHCVGSGSGSHQQRQSTSMDSVPTATTGGSAVTMPRK